MPATQSAIVKNLTRYAETSPEALAEVEALEAAHDTLAARWDALTVALVMRGEGHLIPGTVGQSYRRAAGMLRPRRTKLQKVRDDAHAEALALAGELSELGWEALRDRARAAGVKLKGTRAELERRTLAAEAAADAEASADTLADDSAE